MRRNRMTAWAGMSVLILLLAVVLWQVYPVAADGAPTPNPLTNPPKNPVFAPVPGAQITANGQAVSIHGDPLVGRTIFAQNCVTCHMQRGVGGMPNPGSDDGTVPPLNPIDPGFLDAANGDPAAFVKAVDLFVQHGSRPSGPDPQLSMVGWGDHQLLTQQNIADVEAYVMSLQGMYWPDRFVPPAELQLTANRSDGDTSTMTYRMTIIDQGGDALRNLSLRDQLPAGLSVLSTYAGAAGLNPAKVTGNVVEWQNVGIREGQTLGPFVIVAQIQDPHATIAGNTATLGFTWSSWTGKTSPATVNASTSEAAPATPASVAAATTPAPAAVTTVQMVEPQPAALSWGFSPDTVTVKVGDSIKWTNSATLQHTATADDGSFDTGLVDPGQGATVTFNNAGTFTYHCTPHPWMKATVVVQGT